MSWSQQALDADEVVQRIAERGPTTIGGELYEDAAAWHAVLKGVATGDQTWLRVAAALRPGADAGALRMLSLAAGEALEHAPGAVLRIAAPTLGLERVCGPVDVDDSRYDSYRLATRAIDLRQQRLFEVKDPMLERDRDRCMELLEASKDPLARFYEVDRQ